MRADNWHNIDSLQGELKKFQAYKAELGTKVTPLTDTTRANLLYEVVRNYWGMVTDSALYYARNLEALSKKIGYKKGIGNALNGFGLAYMKDRRFDSAVYYFQKALEVRKEIGDKEGLAWTYNNLGLEYGDQGNYEQGIYYHTLAIKEREELRDSEEIFASYTKRAIAYNAISNFPAALKDYLTVSNYNGVASVYAAMGNYPEAVKYFLKSIAYNQNIRDTNSIAVDKLSLWDVYYRMGDTASAFKTYREFVKDIDRCKRAYHGEDAYYSAGLGAYRMGDYSKALQYYNQVLKLVELSKNQYAQAVNLNAIAEVYEKQGLWQKARSYENRALILAGNVNGKNLMKTSYEQLAKIEAASGNYKAAYKDQVMFKYLNDSIYNKENERKLAFTQIQNDFSRHEDSIKTEQQKKDFVTQQQITRQKTYTAFGFLGIILVALLLFFVYRNYTNQRKANEALAVAKERAEQSEKFKEQFLANMSHEIRTPMHAVLGMTNLVLDTPVSEKQNVYLQAIKKSSENLLVILNDILDLSKLEAGKMELEKNPFRIRDIVNHAADIMRFKMEEKSLQFHVKIAEDVPRVVIGDAPRLNQILLNLLGNAIKFTDRGSVSLSVTSEATAVEGQFSIAFAIRDTGIGMSAEQQQKIFRSFVQGDIHTSRKYGGTGLGLAISKTLVELQGGTIEVHSESGKGSEFKFVIPYKEGKEDEALVTLQAQQNDYSSLKKLKLLVVEDNEFNQIVIKDTLENLLPGIRVEIAGNGKTACEKVERSDYDMVLMDVLMPDMDGFEATRYIRNQLKKKLPVVALTASVIRSDLDKCMAAGMTGYIPKPFTRDELLQELMRQGGN